MPRSRRTYWLYPDLDSPQARRRHQRNARGGELVQTGEVDQYGFPRLEWRAGETPARSHLQLSYQYKVTRDQANLVSSNVDGKEGMHMPCLDLDIPHEYIPSSTEGHGHLYLNVEVPEDKYFALLDLLEECKILEPGYVRASKAKGGTYLRPPGVKKKAKRKTEEVPTRDPRTSAPTREAESLATGPELDPNIVFQDNVIRAQPITEAELRLWSSGVYGDPDGPRPTEEVPF